MFDRQPWLIAFAVGCALLIAATRPLRRVGETLRATARADEAFVFAMFFTALALCCPWVTGEYRMRLALMVPVPLALVVAFLLTRRLEEKSRRSRFALLGAIATAAISVAICVAAVTPVIGDIDSPGMVQIDAEGIEQLRIWRSELGSDGRSIVTAHHGLEFWAGFAMGMHSRQTTFAQSDFDTYEHLYILAEHGGAGRGPGGGMREARGGGRRPMNRPMNDQMKGPTDGPMNGPMHGMGQPQIPDGAIKVRQSERFTLWEVPKSARDSYRDAG